MKKYTLATSILIIALHASTAPPAARAADSDSTVIESFHISTLMALYNSYLITSMAADNFESKIAAPEETKRIITSQHDWLASLSYNIDKLLKLDSISETDKEKLLAADKCLIGLELLDGTFDTWIKNPSEEIENNFKNKQNTSYNCIEQLLEEFQ